MEGTYIEARHNLAHTVELTPKGAQQTEIDQEGETQATRVCIPLQAHPQTLPLGYLHLFPATVRLKATEEEEESGIEWNRGKIKQTKLVNNGKAGNTERSIRLIKLSTQTINLTI